MEVHDRAQWRVKITRESFAADVDEYRAKFGKLEGERRFHSEHAPTDRQDEEGNLLMYGGASILWESLIGNGTSSAAETLSYFSNSIAALGVGDSSTAAAATQTNLLAGTNGYRQVMDSTYPTHTDALTSGAAAIVFKITVGTSNANFAWAEWGIFNGVGSSSPPVGQRMLNRAVTALGTKTSAGSWALTVTITLS
jgi:hypothetical protein